MTTDHHDVGEAVDRLVVKLGRVVVPPYLRVQDGKVEDVSGYAYNRKGAVAKVTEAVKPQWEYVASGDLRPGDVLVSGAMELTIDKVTRRKGGKRQTQDATLGLYSAKVTLDGHDQNGKPFHLVWDAEHVTTVKPRAVTEAPKTKSYTYESTASTRQIHAMLKKAGFTPYRYTASKRGPGIGMGRGGYVLKDYEYRDENAKWRKVPDDYTIRVEFGNSGSFKSSDNPQAARDEEFARLRKVLAELGFNPRDEEKGVLRITAPMVTNKGRIQV